MLFSVLLSWLSQCFFTDHAVCGDNPAFICLQVCSIGAGELQSLSLTHCTALPSPGSERSTRSAGHAQSLLQELLGVRRT